MVKVTALGPPSTAPTVSPAVYHSLAGSSAATVGQRPLRSCHLRVTRMIGRQYPLLLEHPGE
jgi:hypothetical protein